MTKKIFRSKKAEQYYNEVKEIFKTTIDKTEYSLYKFRWHRDVDFPHLQRINGLKNQIDQLRKELNDILEDIDKIDNKYTSWYDKMNWLDKKKEEAK